MKLKCIAFSICILIVGQLSGQNGFQRIFEINEAGDTTLHHLATTNAPTGAMISVFARRIDDHYKTLVLAKQDQKGNFQAKVEYDFGQEDIDDIYDVDIVYNDDVDSVYMAFTMSISGETTAMLGKFKAQTVDSMLTHTVTGVDFSADAILEDVTGFSNIETYYDSSNVYSISDDGVFVSLLNHNNQTLWTQRFELTDEDDNVLKAAGYGLAVSDDSLIYSAGVLEDFRLYQLVLDSQGVEQMAKAYTLDIGNNNPIPGEVAAVTDGQSALTGYYTDASGISTGYVILTDTVGEVTWAKKVTIRGHSTELYNILSTGGGDIIVAGKYFQEPDSTKLFSAALDLNGNIKWIADYGNTVVDIDLKLTSLADGPAGGTVLAANGFNDRGSEGLVYIQQSATGSTPCSDTITAMPFADLTVTTDTLLAIRNIGIIIGDSLAYEQEIYKGLIEPMSNAEEEKDFCPNEPIMELLTEVVDNVDTSKIEYLWSTMATTDTIRVFMEGEYMVTVTISDNTCYTMCDTVELTRLEMVSVSIQEDATLICETGEYILEAKGTGGKRNYTYLWASGETSETINVTENGIYSVKIFDQCGDSATSMINLMIPVNSVTATINQSGDCEFEKTLLASANSVHGGSSINFLWSTGDTSPSIIVTENRSYSVTVTDACGDTDITTIVINDIPELPTDTLVTNIMVTLDCEEEMVTFSADKGTDISEFKWRRYDADFGEIPSGISRDNTIELDSELRFFTLEVVIGCETKILDTIKLEPCPQVCLEYANIFFPNLNVGDMTSDSLNLTFGPIYVCDENGERPEDIASVQGFLDTRLVNYTFAIFNRWGQEVFTTETPSQKWNGRFNGDLVPTEVYIWFATYEYDLDEDGVPDANTKTTDKGDVMVAY